MIRHLTPLARRLVRRRLHTMLHAALAGSCWLLATLLSSAPGRAATCSGVPNDCYFDHGGSNATQVAVGPGLACAVSIAQTTDYGRHVNCFIPIPGNAIQMENAGFIFNESTYFKNTSAERMLSIAIMGTANGAPGPITLYVLRAEGTLFASSGDSTLVNGRMRTRMSDFVVAGFSVTRQNTPITLRMITSVQPPFGGAFVLAVSSDRKLYRLDPTVGVWDKVGDTNYFVGFGGPYGLLASSGTVYATPGVDLPSNILFRLAEPNKLPAFPNASLGIRIMSPPDFNFFGRNQPFSLGTNDAWYLTASSGLYRSKLSSTGWSGWSRATTYAGMGPGTSPWTIADARHFRGRRGEVMYVGDSYRLRTYWTSASSNN
jgi:hypothetical protein